MSERSPMVSVGILPNYVMLKGRRTNLHNLSGPWPQSRGRFTELKVSMCVRFTKTRSEIESLEYWCRNACELAPMHLEQKDSAMSTNRISCCPFSWINGVHPPLLNPLTWRLEFRGAWRNGSASDSRSEGWEFESLCPHLCLTNQRRTWCQSPLG